MTRVPGRRRLSVRDAADRNPEVGRRSFLVGIGAAAALLPGSILMSTMGARPSREPSHRWDRGTVMSFGARGDGRADDTQAFREALARTGSLLIPAGTYLLASTVRIEDDDTSIFAEPGVTIVAGSKWPVFEARNASRLRVAGRGMRIDLNGISDCGIRVVGEPGSIISGIDIEGLTVTNHMADIRPASSALEIRGAADVSVSDVSIGRYGYEQDVWSVRTDSGRADGQVYSLGLFDCHRVRVRALRITDACVGVEVQGCTDVSISEFELRRGVDNGFYLLAGSNDVRLADGLVDHFEEGIVILSPGVRITRVQMVGCSNKAITLRHAFHTRIADCTFRDNTLGIGDDGSGREVSDVVISGCRFAQRTGRAIYLTTLSASRIDMNTFEVVGNAVRQLVRLNDAVNVHITRNIFADDNRSSEALLTLAGDSERCDVTDNTFASGKVGVALRGSPHGIDIRRNEFGTAGGGLRTRITRS